MTWFISPKSAETSHPLGELISCWWLPGEPKVTSLEEFAVCVTQTGGDEPYPLQGWRGVQIPENVINTWNWYRQELTITTCLVWRQEHWSPSFTAWRYLFSSVVQSELIWEWGFTEKIATHLTLTLCTLEKTILNLSVSPNFLAFILYATWDSMLLRDHVIFNFSFPLHQAKHSIIKWWFHFLIFLFSSQCVFANQFHKPLHASGEKGCSPPSRGPFPSNQT